MLKDPWDDDQKKEHQHWMTLFSHLIAEWAQWLGVYLFQFIGNEKVG